MKKICVVITARSSYARVKSVLRELKKRQDVELFLLTAGSLLLSKYGNALQDIEKDGFLVNEKVHMGLENGDTVAMAKATAVGIIDFVTIFNNHTPDIVVSIADRFETISTAIAASYLNIPLAHIQGGEISGSIDGKVRHAVTKFSSLHFVANNLAAKRIRLMGEPDESIFVTGCPSIDLAKEIIEHPRHLTNEYFYSQYKGVGDMVDIDKPFVILLQHPVTTEWEEAYSQMNETLMAVYDKKIPAIVFWPNADAGTDMLSKAIRTFREKYNPKGFYFLKHIPAEDFLTLLLKSRCVAGNSSVAIREGSFLGIPAVNIGTRQEGRERCTNVIDVQYSKNEIMKGLDYQLNRNHLYPSETLYGDGTAGAKIASILAKHAPAIKKKFVE